MIYVRKFIATCEGYGWTGGPVFNTRKVAMANRRERRNADSDQPLHQFSVPFNNITQPQYVPIKQMHLNRRGGWGNFLFRDRLDDYANDELFGLGDGAEDTFQLAKLSEQDGVEYFNTVHAIYTPDDEGNAIESDIVVTVNDAPTTAYTLDHDTGVIVFDTPPGSGAILRWSGQFARWVHFASDDLPFSIDNKSGGEFVVNGSIEVVEEFPPSAGEVSSSS